MGRSISPFPHFFLSLGWVFWIIIFGGFSRNVFLLSPWSETGFCLKSDFGRAHQFQHKHRTFHSLKACAVCTQKTHHFKLLSISVGRYQVSQSLVKAFSVRNPLPEMLSQYSDRTFGNADPIVPLRRGCQGPSSLPPR